MTVLIRLYAKTDPDLIILDSCEGFSAGLWMTKAVKAYVRNEELVIPLPETASEKITIEDRQVHFGLSSNSDGDVIEMLRAIRPRFRNTVIKLLIRAYLEKPFLNPFFVEYSYRCHEKKEEARDRKTRKEGKSSLPSSLSARRRPASPQERTPSDPSLSDVPGNKSRDPADRQPSDADAGTCEDSFDLFSAIGGLMS